MKPLNRQILLLISHFTLWYPAQFWDLNFMFNIILPMTKMLQSQEVIWFISLRMNTEESENVQNLMNRIHTRTLLPQTVLTNNSDVRAITHSKRNYVGIVFTTGVDDPIMRVHDMVLKGRHYYLNFMILVRLTNDFSIVEQLLRALHRINFVNTFLYVGYSNSSSDLYGYSIYPDYKIEVRTDLVEFVKTASIHHGDYMGYKLRIPRCTNVPDVFAYQNPQGFMEVRGITYKILEFFVTNVNATLVEYVVSSDNALVCEQATDMKAAINLIRKRKLRVLGHTYALFAIDDEVDKSYPLMVVRWCLMVPIWNVVSTSYYPVKPFDVSVWCAVLLTFIILSATDCLWILSHRLDESNATSTTLMWSLRNCVLNNFCFIINTATGKSLTNPSIMRFLFYATVWFHGFFLMANYTSCLGSILAVSWFRDQINTMDDLLKAQLPVMIIDYEYDFLLSGGLNLPANFMQLLKQVDAATFSRHQLAMNQSFAYFVTEDKWQFLDKQQKHLKHGLFKLTDICFGSYHLAFPMEQDSPMWRDMEYFLYRVHSSGMFYHYQSTAFEDALRMGWVKRYTEDTEYTAADMQHLQMVFAMLLGMASTSSLVFLGELGLYWLKRRGKRKG